MTRDNLVTAPEETLLEDAQRILLENKVEKLLLVDRDYRLKGLITIKDIDKNHRFPLASKDTRGRLRVGAAVGVSDFDRVEALREKGSRRPGRRQCPRALGKRCRDGQGDQAAARNRCDCRQRGPHHCWGP
ncbi:MAG: hypothetical protein Ct9H300mP1_20300 [Planctomycetaceae bacterium]|nr:MAG: hypothetical protein Ct9H300mP1_20300 [Planctomycetaceae bacterium]